MDNNTEASSEKRESRRPQRVDPIRKSLAFVLSSFQGKGVVVELKDDSEVYGVVEEVDKSTSMVLVNCRQVFSNGKELHKESIHINGTAIRYVHLPAEVKISPNLESYAAIIDKLGKISKPKSYVETESRKKRLRLE